MCYTRKAVFEELIILKKVKFILKNFSISKEILIDAKQANKIAIQIAKGVEYLHQNLECILPKLQLNSKHIMVDFFVCFY